MTTFLDLTNRLLRRTNNVQIPDSNFAAASGIQATAKDCILDTIRMINNGRVDWPFNAVEHTQVLSIGVEEYAWPTQFTSADWDSFQIQKDTTLNQNSKVLEAISREEWYGYLRDHDYDNATTGLNVPNFVFPSHGNGWGVSPGPNQAYTVKYRYYLSPPDLVASTDQPTIPSRFDYVIVAGGLYHLNLFLEDAQGVQIMQQKFNEGIGDMTHQYLPNPLYLYGTQVNFGGGLWRGNGFFWNRGY